MAGGASGRNEPGSKSAKEKQEGRPPHDDGIVAV